jgi:hypothetical protein
MEDMKIMKNAFSILVLILLPSQIQLLDIENKKKDSPYTKGNSLTKKPRVHCKIRYLNFELSSS